MRQIIVLMIGLLFSIQLYASQESENRNKGMSENITYNISGIIVNKASGKALQGITVGIEELKIIAYSDKKGRFVFKSIRPGKYHLRFSHPTYEEEIIPIRLKRNFHINIELKGASYALNKIENYYSRREDRFGEQHIMGKNIKDLPMRGAGDSLHLLQTLPGIGGGFALATVPIIRGGNPLHDRLYIDDLPVDFPYHYLASIVPLISSVNEEIIDRASVIKGLSPMFYDDNLGNIIQIKTKDPQQMNIHGRAIFDPAIPVFPTLSVTIVPTSNLSVMFSGRRSYVDMITDYEETDLYFQDHYLKLTYNLFSRHRLFFIAFGVDDYLSIDDYTTRSRYNIEALKWEYLINKKIFLKTLLSIHQMEHYIENEDVYRDMVGVLLRFNPTQYRIFHTLHAKLKNYHIKTGFEIIAHKDGIEGNVSLNDIPDLDIFDNTSMNITEEYPIEGASYSLFSEFYAEYKPLWINLGVKYKRYGPLSNKSFSYRGMCGLDINKRNTVYTGGGVYHAHPDMYYYIGESEPKFTDSQAFNGIVGIKSRLFSGITGQVELYHYDYKNLSSANTDIINDSEYKKITQINPFSIEGEGKSQGVEFLIKGSHKHYYGWISYAYSISKRSSERYNKYDYFSDFDQTHLLTLTLASTFGHWTPSMIFHYYSALPYTPIIGSTEDNGEHEAVYGVYNAKRFPAHHRLDLKLTYTNKNNSRFYIEVWNFYYNQGNRLFQKFDEDKPYGPDNPESQSDYPPVFVWLGIELCF
ncbi:MAG: TonB-dependent receptor [Spirochaetota bacterium]|nr:TonB-dependent receptor [Spirochaetota bacterium]